MGESDINSKDIPKELGQTDYFQSSNDGIYIPQNPLSNKFDFIKNLFNFESDENVKLLDNQEVTTNLENIISSQILDQPVEYNSPSMLKAFLGTYSLAESLTESKDIFPESRIPLNQTSPIKDTLLVTNTTILKILENFADYANQVYCDRSGEVFLMATDFSAKTIIDGSSKTVIFSIKGNDEKFYSQGLLPLYTIYIKPRRVNQYIYEVFLNGSQNMGKLVENISSEYPDSRIAFTGHGSGGALAILVALSYIGINPHLKTEVYTFGSPRIANFVFAYWANSLLEKNQISIYRVTRHYDDRVKYPTSWYPWYYNHFGVEFWINENEKVFECQPQFNFESWECSNSKTEIFSESHWGPYMGVTMKKCV
ncbi:hypothetical protein G9A89_012460 [Geosiphon pyriformis]|nr:hypothetical protein G9A89_012460 [Geosiphon pyriformis]